MRTMGIMAATLLAASALGSASAQTITYTVDCAKGQTIAGALARADSRSPLLVNVRGTCNEFVAIARDNVTLRGDPTATIVAPNATSDVVAVDGNGVTLENLTLTGGYYGVRNNQVVRLNVRNSVIQDTASDGIRVFVGDTRVIGSTIQRAGGNGVYVTRGGSLGASGNSQFLNNANAGIYAYGNSTAAVSGSTISGNVTGVRLEPGAEGTFSNTTISGNSGVGITVASSQATIGGNNVITNNGAWGIWVYSGSTATIYGNRVADNAWDGISGDIGTTLILNGNQITGNGSFGVACRTNCTMELNGETLEGNGGGGVLVETGSKLMFANGTTHWTGDGWGLQCSDKESSVGNLGLFDGTVSDTCTDFDH